MHTESRGKQIFIGMAALPFLGRATKYFWPLVATPTLQNSPKDDWCYSETDAQQRSHLRLKNTGCDPVVANWSLGFEERRRLVVKSLGSELQMTVSTSQLGYIRQDMEHLSFIFPIRKWVASKLKLKGKRNKTASEWLPFQTNTCSELQCSVPAHIWKIILFLFLVSFKQAKF